MENTDKNNEGWRVKHNTLKRTHQDTCNLLIQTKKLNADKYKDLETKHNEVVIELEIAKRKLNYVEAQFSPLKQFAECSNRKCEQLEGAVSDLYQQANHDQQRIQDIECQLRLCTEERSEVIRQHEQFREQVAKEKADELDQLREQLGMERADQLRQQLGMERVGQLRQQLEKEKADELDQLRQQLAKEKADEMDQLREQLAKEKADELENLRQQLAKEKADELENLRQQLETTRSTRFEDESRQLREQYEKETFDRLEVERRQHHEHIAYMDGTIQTLWSDIKRHRDVNRSICSTASLLF